MTQRIQLSQRGSEPCQQLLRLHSLVENAAADAGLDQRLIELVKIRGSMLNGCSFCLDLHTRTARRLGETERRIYLLGAWKETDIHRPGAHLRDRLTGLPDQPHRALLEVLIELLAYSFPPRSPDPPHLAVLKRPGFVRAAAYLWRGRWDTAGLLLCRANDSERCSSGGERPSPPSCRSRAVKLRAS